MNTIKGMLRAHSALSTLTGSRGLGLLQLMVHRKVINFKEHEGFFLYYFFFFFG